MAFSATSMLLLGLPGARQSASHSLTMVALPSSFTKTGFDPKGYGHFVVPSSCERAYLTRYAHLSHLNVKVHDELIVDDRIGNVRAAGWRIGARRPAHQDWVFTSCTSRDTMSV
jgi:hypothetical protein